MNKKEYEAVVQEQKEYENSRKEQYQQEKKKTDKRIAEIEQSNLPEEERQKQKGIEKAELIKRTGKKYPEIIEEEKRLNAIAAYEAGDRQEKKDVILENDLPHTVAAGFVDWSEVTHRYNAKDGWTICVKNKYQKIEDPTEIEFYIRKFITIMQYKKREKDGDEYIEKVCKTGHKHQTSGFIKSAMEWLRDNSDVHLRPNQSAPCSLDRRFEVNRTIALQNCLVDIETFKTYPLSEDFYTINYLPVKWRENAPRAMWNKFLDVSTQGDTELQLQLQQFAGYCLMPHTQMHQKFMIIYGEAKTGKSVFTDVLSYLFGEQNVSWVPINKFDDEKHFIRTYGRLVNMSEESVKHVEDSVEQQIKHHTGGGKMTYRNLYQSSFEAKPTAKILIVTNQKPTFRDTSGGTWRRLLLSPFEHYIPEKERIYNLQDKIRDEELCGVLQWAMEGAASLREYGFLSCSRSEKEVEKYRREGTPEIEFLEDNYKPGTPMFQDEFITCKGFRKDYEMFCEENGIKPKSIQKLKPTIERMFGTSNTYSCKIDYKAVRCRDNMVRKTEDEKAGDGDTGHPEKAIEDEKQMGDIQF